MYIPYTLQCAAGEISPKFAFFSGHVGPHPTDAFLGPCKSIRQTAPRSVQPFMYSARFGCDRLTHTQTETRGILATSVTTARI